MAGQSEELEDSDSEDEVGGLFRIAKHEKERKQTQGDNALDCTKFLITVQRDWSDRNVREYLVVSDITVLKKFI